jgi:hypothetical protein
MAWYTCQKSAYQSMIQGIHLFNNSIIHGERDRQTRDYRVQVRKLTPPVADDDCIRVPASASNHEEAMGCVAAELFDQAIFPIEIGLHREGAGVGALVGTPVAM